MEVLHHLGHHLTHGLRAGFFRCGQAELLGEQLAGSQVHRSALDARTSDVDSESDLLFGYFGDLLGIVLLGIVALGHHGFPSSRSSAQFPPGLQCFRPGVQARSSLESFPHACARCPPPKRSMRLRMSEQPNAELVSYYILVTGKLEYGLVSPWTERIGPYPNYEAVAHGLVRAKERNEEWQRQIAERDGEE